MSDATKYVKGLSAAVVYAYRQDDGGSRALAYLIGKLERALQDKAAAADVAGNAGSVEGADVVQLRSRLIRR